MRTKRVRIYTPRLVYVLACRSNVVQKRVHVGHDQIIPGSKLQNTLSEGENAVTELLTLMQVARHLAAAANGGGARLSDGNPYSNNGIGEVMNRRK